jgi:hypothetical protein
VGLSLVASVAVAWSWVRSRTQLDQYMLSRLVFTGRFVPGAAPPASRAPPAPGYALPPVGYEGTYVTWQFTTLPGRFYIARSEVTSWYPTADPPTNMKPHLGWKHDGRSADMAMTFNVPRGNVWLSWREFNWYGLATWDTYMDGQSARMVMIPHWLALIAAALPAMVVLAVVGWRRVRCKPGRCASCGYDRRGVTGVCPECGDAAATR